VADPLWSGVLDSVTRKPAAGTYAQLCFNYRNPLVRRLVRVKDRAVLQRSIQMLYVQALLLGHHPLSAREMALLNEGLLHLIEAGLAGREEKGG
jgi:molecular chaperone HtpG